MKKIASIVIMILCGVMLIGCGREKLSDKYSEDTLTTATENIITLLNEGKYEEIVKKGGSTFEAAGVEDKIKSAHESMIKNAGDFESNTKMVFQEKSGYAVVVTKSKYEKKNIQYTFTFGEDLKIYQLFMK
ncbi:MAG: DUF3887 domain-containing protein [Clostridium sp.]